MNLRTTIASAVGALALAAAAAYAPVASADRVGFNLTFGGPGYAVNVGNAGSGYYNGGYGYYDGGYGYYDGAYGYYDYGRPAPVVVVPYAPYYRPYRRPYYAPVVVRPYPVYRPYPGHRTYDGHRQHWRQNDRSVGYVHYDR